MNPLDHKIINKKHRKSTEPQQSGFSIILSLSTRKVLRLPNGDSNEPGLVKVDSSSSVGEKEHSVGDGKQEKRLSQRG